MGLKEDYYKIKGKMVKLGNPRKHPDVDIKEVLKLAKDAESIAYRLGERGNLDSEEYRFLGIVHIAANDHKGAKKVYEKAARIYGEKGYEKLAKEYEREARIVASNYAFIKKRGGSGGKMRLR
jgi:hypothetical protein